MEHRVTMRRQESRFLAKSGREHFWTTGLAMIDLLARTRRAAASEVPVLIEAEMGAGAKTLARFIHGESRRAAGRFVVLHCPSLPDAALESGLSRRPPGPSGGVRERKRDVESTQIRTVLLEDIEETTPRLQAAVLQLLQARDDRSVERGPHQGEVRIIATTPRNLEPAVRTGHFSEGLYNRFHVLRIPPLRERVGDIPRLVERLCASDDRGRGPFHVSAGALTTLLSYSWPGNVRELQRIVNRAKARARRPELEAIDFFPAGGLPTSRGILLTSGLDVPSRTTREAQRSLIEDALRVTEGNRTRAAAIVGVSVRTLRNRLRLDRVLDGSPETDHRGIRKPA